MKKRAVSPKREHLLILYAALVIIYLAVLALIVVIGQSHGMVRILGGEMPVASLASVVSTIGSLCAFFLVIFFKKRGFVTAIVLLLMQAMIMFIGFFSTGSLSGLPGLFGVVLVIIANVFIYQRDEKVDKLRAMEMDTLKARQKGAELLFEQTATSLVNAIDAKDVYSRGHSMRVAEYSRKIAETMGKSEEECREVYYAGLLHDVGKIGIQNAILTKKGKLTSEEYEEIKRHAVIGKQILSGITAYPYLSIAANSHHERYDGKGYPDKWKGNDIPEIARIISVADAYDAMSSNRSYRDALPQQLVREEIVKGSGTQFDPEIAKVMQHLIDLDSEYRMKEREEVKELAGKNELKCTEYRHEVSEGILITREITKLHLRSVPDDAGSGGRAPTVILFDSLDGRVHDEPKMIKDLNYFEYAEVWLDGRAVLTGARTAKTERTAHAPRAADPSKAAAGVAYDVEIVRYRDHLAFDIDDGQQTTRVTIALPDCTRYAYVALTGERCHLMDVSIAKAEGEIDGNYIERIAPEISYIDRIEGDIPNVQVDGFRTAASQGIPITDGLEIRFHTMSLPTARLVWHCPYISIFTSEDGQVNGEKFREYALVRFDGENWEAEDDIVNELTVNRQAEFIGWDAWKENNKKGYDCAVMFERQGNKITLTTENFGIFIRNTTYAEVGKEVYMALTGDQCALTDIRIRKH